MSVQKLSIEQVPKEVLGDLEVLSSNSSKEYIAVGSSYYCLTPMPAVILMDVLGKFMEALEGIRRKVIEELLSELPPEKQKEFNPNNVFITIRDLLRDPDSVILMKDLLQKVLDGIDQADFDSLTSNQLVKIIDAVVKININTLPQSFREALLPGSTAGVVEELPKEEEGNKVKNP